MIEWANRLSITLQSGTQMYDEMRQAYEDGAEYAVAFNYSPSGNGTGLLQAKQFASIQKFWTDVVQNPKVTNNVTAQDALVLPTDTYSIRDEKPKRHYMGHMATRRQFTTSWNSVQQSLAKYGSRLDIVYADHLLNRRKIPTCFRSVISNPNPQA